MSAGNHYDDGHGGGGDCDDVDDCDACGDDSGDDHNEAKADKVYLQYKGHTQVSPAAPI